MGEMGGGRDAEGGQGNWLSGSEVVSPGFWFYFSLCYCVG